MVQMVSMPPLACAGLSGDTGVREPRRNISLAIQKPWASSIMARPEFTILPRRVFLILFLPLRCQALPVDSASRVHDPFGDFPANPVLLSRTVQGKSCC